MARNGNWKTWVILGTAAAVMITSGGLLMASNFGFKINKGITSNFTGATAPKGYNWISLPYSSPYANAKAVCAAAGVTTNAGTLTFTDPPSGTNTSFLCGAAGPGFLLTGNSPGGILMRTLGLRLTVAGAGIANAVFVGSSDETIQISLLKGFLGNQAPKLYNWISVPYHTTWIKANDICVTVGNATNAVTITRIAGSTGTPTTHLCGQGAAGAGNFSLVVGESVRITWAGAGAAAVFFPPHF